MKIMIPLRETFGEEWVGSDDDEPAGFEEANEEVSFCLGTVVDDARNGGFEWERTETSEADKEVAEDDKECLKPSKCEDSEGNINMEGENSPKIGLSTFNGFKSSTNRDGKGIFKVEKVHEGVNGSSGSGGRFCSKGEQCAELKLDEQDLGIQALKDGIDDIFVLKEDSCLGWARPRGNKEKGAPVMKRVMSEASFMQGQIMVSKSESIQEVMSKRELSRGYEGGAISTERIARVRGKREMEVEVTIKECSNVEAEEGVEMLVVCISPGRSSPRDTGVCTSSPSPEGAYHGKLNCPDRLPKSMGTKADLKETHMMSEWALQAPQQTSPKEPSRAMKDEAQLAPHGSEARTTLGTSLGALDGADMHVERAKGGAKMQPHQATGTERPVVPSKPCGSAGEARLEEKASRTLPPKASKGVGRGRVKAVEVGHKGGGSSHGGGGEARSTAGGQLEVKEVECECCGLAEECTRGYVEHVKGIFSGHWICGLCAEAVNEEKHRLGRGIPMKEAVRTHMSLCKQFSSEKKAGEPPQSPGVAHAVCHLLSRHLSDPRQITTANTRPHLSRASSCLSSFSHKPPSCSSS